MKKCPYCGWESEHDICDHCKAAIPSEKPKEEPRRVKNKDKELK